MLFIILLIEMDRPCFEDGPRININVFVFVQLRVPMKSQNFSLL